MCIGGGGKMPEVKAPTRYAAMKKPDGGAVMSNSQRRVQDRKRSAANSIFTSTSGVQGANPTTYKQLLGQ